MDPKVKVIKIITVSAVVLMFLLAVSLIINLVKLANVSSTKARLEAQVAQLDKEIAENDQYIADLESSDYLDWCAREHLNMKGRDEKAFSAREK